MSLAILVINLLPSRRGLSLMAAPRKPLVLMGAGSLPLARTGHRKFRVRQILRPSDSSKRTPAKAPSWSERGGRDGRCRMLDPDNVRFTLAPEPSAAALFASPCVRLTD